MARRVHFARQYQTGRVHALATTFVRSESWLWGWYEGAAYAAQTIIDTRASHGAESVILGCNRDRPACRSDRFESPCVWSDCAPTSAPR